MIEVECHLDGVESTLAADVADGLTRPLKELPPKHLYDERGCALFDRICELPEYYPTRAERDILRDEAPAIAATSAAAELVELGAGTASKTRVLLDALAAAGTLARYVPFDVAPGVVHDTAAAIAAEYAGTRVHGVIGDFDHHLDRLPEPGGTRLVAFLGGTIGNLAPAARAEFLAAVAALLGDGDHLLLGTDLVKDEATLVAAYDDAAGVTAEFNRNVLHVLNRELDADFDVANFVHVARWDPDREWMEMRLRAREACRVRVDALDVEVDFAAGEEMRTEISAKFTRERVAAELAAAGLRIVRWMTDRRRRFALTLAAPA